MNDIWETLKAIGTDFVQNTGLAIVRAIAFLILGLIVIKIVRIIARSAAMKSSKLDRSASTFIISIITVVLYVVLVIVLVSSLGFSTAGIIAAFSAVALAIALALKDSLASLANGVIIIFTKPFKKGDYIAIGGLDGLVQDIRLFNTKILTYSNEEIIVPNSEVLGSKLINYSAMPLRRVVFDVPVPYGVDVAEVKAMLLDAVASYKYTVTTPAPSVVLADYGESTLKFSVRAWGLTENYWDLYYDLREIALNTLTEHGIEKPFNRLEVKLRDDWQDRADDASPEGAADGSPRKGGDA
ncbi:MAG TPA: mechanosensitive ion channel family protein [Firmicutes bacterium]|nr:mechanosensitive ion channel family protein [Bacillota bacterium]